MGSIPLPALHVQPPEDPTAGLQRAIQLKSLLNQQALMPGQLQQQQQQIQATGLENQQRAQALKDQQAQTAAMQEWDGKSIDDLPGLVLKHGASATAVMSLKNGIITQKQNLANLDKDTLANEDKRNDQLLGHIDAIRNGADPKTQANQILSAGLVKDPQTTQLVQAIAAGQYTPDDSHLDMMDKGLRSHSAMLADAKTQAEAAEKTAQAKKLNLETNPENPADQNIARQKYQGILQAIQTGGVGSVPDKDLKWARAHEAAETKRTTQSDTLGVTSSNVSGPAGLSVAGAGGRTQPAAGPNPIAASSPGVPRATPSSGGSQPSSPASAKESIVDAIGQYKASPQLLSRMMTKHPDILGFVTRQYPDWNQPDYNARNAMVTKFTSGKESHEINAINTAMGHLKNLDDAVDALHNGDVTLLNKIGTAYNINVAGKTAESAFQLIARRVAPEITQAYVTGGGGEHERFANEGDFSVNLPPQTLHNNAAITVKMLRSKVGSLENQWSTTMGRNDFQQRFISPEAQRSFNKFSGGGGAGGGGAATKVYQGHTYAQQPDGSWQRQ